MIEIEMKITKMVQETTKVKVVDHAIVPGFISDGTCPICLWGLHEDQESKHILACRTENNQVVYCIQSA